ncbi:MAG: hypothetical protein QOJ29_4183 [Thermoleophilaceae bacterium]|nr:hypothetical protein [Thermoleophilaceae bacterium]
MGHRLLAVAAVVVAMALAGCGGATGSSPEPGSIVPGSAYLYVEANLSPSGDQQDAVRTVLASLPGVGDPSRRLQEQFNAYAQRRYGRRAARFERDIAPWLGERIAAFSLLPSGGGDVARAPSGIIAATRDAKKARHWLFVVARRPAERDRTYKGVRYLWMAGDERLAYSIVDGFVVAADEAAFKAIVDRRRGAALAERPRFANVVTRAGDNRLGLVWYDTRRLADTVARNVSAAYLRSALPAIRRLIPADPVVLTIRAKKKALVLDGQVSAGKGGALTSLFDEGGALIDQLPRDAIAVVGQPDFGNYMRKLLALSNADDGGYSGLRRQLRRDGFDIERSLLGWMTDAAVFLRKDRDGTLGGALVVQSGDADSVYYGTLRLGRYLVKSGADARDVRLPGSDLSFSLRLPGMRKKIYVAEAGKRMVVAYGADSAEAAISVGGLGGEPHYEAARAHLGPDWGPAAYVDIQRLLAVLGPGSLGGARELVKPLRYLIVGGRVDGKRLRSHTELVVR